MPKRSLKLAESFSAQAIALGLGNGDTLEQHNQLREIFKKWLLDSSKRSSWQNDAMLKVAEFDWSLGTPDRSIPWLMIFDDVNDVTILGQYWPKGALGSIILTTRDPEVARTYAPLRLEVPVFRRKESEELLLSWNHGIDQNDAVEKNAVTKIAERMGDLPLALTLVAGYVSSISSSYDTFLKNYPIIGRDFLFRGPGNQSRSPQAYQKSVNSTWTHGLQTMDPNACLLMETLALLDKDGLSLEFFRAVPAEHK